MKHTKMYKVTFNHYYNDSDYNTISSMKLNEDNYFVDEDGKENGSNYDYLHIPYPFIIREDEIEKYKNMVVDINPLNMLAVLLKKKYN